MKGFERQLEVAAHDGRLAAVAGFGERRTRLVRDQLDATLRRFGHPVRRKLPAVWVEAPAAPSVEALLSVDAEYRARALAGELRTTAPRREGQCTVVAARRGPLAGRRVVRGREEERPAPL
jgi:hypothetical protein